MHRKPVIHSRPVLWSVLCSAALAFLLLPGGVHAAKRDATGTLYLEPTPKKTETAKPPKKAPKKSGFKLPWARKKSAKPEKAKVPAKKTAKPEKPKAPAEKAKPKADTKKRKTWAERRREKAAAKAAAEKAAAEKPAVVGGVPVGGPGADDASLLLLRDLEAVDYLGEGERAKPRPRKKKKFFSGFKDPPLEAGEYRIVVADSPFYSFGPSQGMPDTRLPEGDLVTLLEWKKGFSKIRMIGDRVGWVSNHSLEAAGLSDLPLSDFPALALPPDDFPIEPVEEPTMPDGQPNPEDMIDTANLLEPPLMDTEAGKGVDPGEGEGTAEPGEEAKTPPVSGEPVEEPSGDEPAAKPATDDAGEAVEKSADPAEGDEPAEAVEPVEDAEPSAPDKTDGGGSEDAMPEAPPLPPEAE